MLRLLQQSGRLVVPLQQRRVEMNAVNIEWHLQALLGANWPNQLQKHKLTRTATLAGLSKSTATSQPAPGQENVPVSHAPPSHA